MKRYPLLNLKNVMHYSAPPLEPEAAGDSVDHDKQKYVKPIRCNTDIAVTMLEWTTETTKENGETDSFSETKTFDVPEMTISAW